MEALFLQSDGRSGLLDYLGGNTSTLLVAFIGVALLFVGYRYIRKAGIR